MSTGLPEASCTALLCEQPTIYVRISDEEIFVAREGWWVTERMTTPPANYINADSLPCYSGNFPPQARLLAKVSRSQFFLVASNHLDSVAAWFLCKHDAAKHPLHSAYSSALSKITLALPNTSRLETDIIASWSSPVMRKRQKSLLLYCRGISDDWVGDYALIVPAVTCSDTKAIFQMCETATTSKAPVPSVAPSFVLDATSDGFHVWTAGSRSWKHYTCATTPELLARQRAELKATPVLQHVNEPLRSLCGLPVDAIMIGKVLTKASIAPAFGIFYIPSTNDIQYAALRAVTSTDPCWKLHNRVYRTVKFRYAVPPLTRVQVLLDGKERTVVLRSINPVWPASVAATSERDLLSENGVSLPTFMPSVSRFVDPLEGIHSAALNYLKKKNNPSVPSPPSSASDAQVKMHSGVTADGEMLYGGYNSDDTIATSIHTESTVVDVLQCTDSERKASSTRENESYDVLPPYGTVDGDDVATAVRTSKRRRRPTTKVLDRAKPLPAANAVRLGHNKKKEVKDYSAAAADKCTTDAALFDHVANHTTSRIPEGTEVSPVQANDMHGKASYVHINSALSSSEHTSLSQTSGLKRSRKIYECSAAVAPMR